MGPLFQANGVTKRFGGFTAVSGVDLTLGTGESVGVIGPNGAGKSTLLGLIVGSLRADAGTLELEGRDMSRLSLPDRVQGGIARAAQIPQTFARLTVRENLRLPAVFGARLHGAEASDWVDEVLTLTGLTDHAGAVAGELGLLSRKRLELAKAVAARPRLLLLDEIAAGLTQHEIETMIGLVKSLRSDRAIVWVEHIPFALRETCERLVVLDKGEKILDGAFATVWEDERLQSVYMGVADHAAA
ncbi:ABC transporter ATP-binding protein [Salipiger sp. IMCC34102]|uniref:ABC transporter ATP-binding protein n=1 Tax=Salipiger sp. IMCC34102 TaxID=2510647 RepID=UPI0013ECB324|nr:ATP-binding cassette domain-containing protein [Salipiger sp. IMCC34102]